ncbi:MAG: hypothetical protein ACPLRJ_04615 [Infirmifilum uzonense]|uniref:hypothetical protein n=1 Tax=Infirmifilum uzonense TaxID=1550241 RepID=UPI003C75F8FB
MVKEIKVFLPRTPEAQAMLEAFKAELNVIPKQQRPRLAVRLLMNLKDPSKYQEWLENLDELFGGIYTAEFKKYGISAIPAVVVDGEKVVEGRYLGREEIKLLIQGLSPDLANIPALESQQPLELKPVQPTKPPVQAKQLSPTTTPEKPPTQPVVETQKEPPPIELAPVELEEKPIRPARPQPKAIQPEQQPPPRQTAPPKYPTPPVSPAPQAQPSRPHPSPTVQPPVQQTPPPQPKPAPQMQRQEKPQPGISDLTGTCFTCVFYDQAKSRCKLLHVNVPDPTNPPCGRRKPRT